jgi:hypothetical protein
MWRAWRNRSGAVLLDRLRNPGVPVKCVPNETEKYGRRHNIGLRLSRPLKSGHDARKAPMNRDKSENRPPPLVSLFRGLYTRVAQKLGVDPSYVSRVARGERESDAVTAVLSTEMRKIFERAGNHNGNHSHLTANHDGKHSSGASRVAAKEKKAQKQEANLTVASVRKETAQPRVAKSARIEE